MQALASYDWIIINTSAGKDSQAMTDYVIERARAEGVLDRVVMVHADLGRIEWEGTKELAEQHARHYGCRFIVVRRRQVGDLLAEIRRRGKWPSSTERYCTSYYKRDQIAKVYTMLAAESRAAGKVGQVRILNCLGFRSEESPRRKKLPQFATNARATGAKKRVDDWLPIQDWTVQMVWDRIKQAGTQPHPAYSKGMTRLSCQFCIFAPRSQLIISAKENPALFAEYVQAERDMGHKFRVSLSLVELDAAIKAGEQPCQDDGNWNM